MLWYSPLDVALIFFAAYRLAMLLHHDDELGPGQIVYKLKLKLGVKETVHPLGTSQIPQPPGPPLYGLPGTLQEALLCYFCNSPWIALGLALISFFFILIDARIVGQLLLLPFAASGFTILVARYTEKK